MKNLSLWVAAVSFFGMIGATARYLYELGKRNDSFSFRKWLVATFIGATIAVITGLVCKRFMLSDELLYAFVGISAISSRVQALRSPQNDGARDQARLPLLPPETGGPGLQTRSAEKQAVGV